MIKSVSIIKYIDGKSLTLVKSRGVCNHAFAMEITDEGRQAFKDGKIEVKDGYVLDCEIDIEVGESSSVSTHLRLHQFHVAPYFTLTPAMFAQNDKPEVVNCVYCCNALKKVRVRDEVYCSHCGNKLN